MSPLRRPRLFAAVVFAVAACGSGGAAAPAAAFPLKPLCTVAGAVNALAGKACAVVQNGRRIVGAGKNLLEGHLGGAVNALFGGGGSSATAAVSLAAIGAWVLGGAKFALDETAKVIGRTTSPQLGTTWFSSTYWRMAGIAAVLTLPFLFAAAVQALLHADLALLLRAILGYLPLAALAVSVAAPLTMLLLAASDQLSAVVSAAAGNASVHFLTRAGAVIGGLSILAGSPFLAFLIGIFTVAAAVLLWLELLMREAAVYVIVLMLPLAFAALVWPARRVWAVRSAELLVALIVSKFAIVAVLSLGGAAVAGSVTHGDVTGWMLGLVLVVMGAFSPWALLRLLPMAELASGAMGSLRQEARALQQPLTAVTGYAGEAEDWARTATARMSRDAEDASSSRAAEASRDERDADAPGAGMPGEDRPGLDGGGGSGALGPGGGTLGPSGGALGPGGGALGPSGGTLGPGGGALDPGGGTLGPGGGERGAAVPEEERHAGGSRKRSPGLGPISDAEDLSWQPLPLEFDGEWPPRVWPVGNDADAAGGASAPAPQDGSPERPDAATPLAPEGPADHPDPTPPPQSAGPGDDPDPLPPPGGEA